MRINFSVWIGAHGAPYFGSQLVRANHRAERLLGQHFQEQ